MEDHVGAMLRADVLEICIATAFLVVGLISCAIAAIRRGAGIRVFLWIGVWSASYGLMHLLEVRVVQLAAPSWLQAMMPYAITAVGYLLVVVASCAWLELIVGTMRRIVIGFVIASSITAGLGISWFVVTA